MRRILTILLLFISIVSFGQTNYYVATTGDNGAAGTIGAPWASFSFAATQTGAGDTVFFRGGTYYETERVFIDSVHCGEEGNRLVYMSYPGEYAIFDFSNYTQAPSGGPGTNTYSHGILLNIGASFVTLKDFTVRKVLQQVPYTQAFGIYSFASNNVIYDHIIVHDIGGRAFFHETPWGFTYEGYNEPAYDTVRYINCDAYQNCDSIDSYTGMPPTDIGNAADGFKEYGEAGSVIYYTNCRTWKNSDDGWDGGSGTIQYIDNCWSFDNGDLEGDGNGFKLGAHENAALNALDPILTTLKNVITAYNRLSGYFWLEYEDYYRIQGRMYNCVSYEDGGAGITTSNNALPGRENIKWQIYNSLFYSSDPTWNAVSAAYKTYTESHNTWDLVPNSFPGWEWTDTVTFTPIADFVVTDSATIMNQLKASRKADGSLPDLTAFRLSGSSDLIGAGKNYGMSATPDIGIDWAYYDLGSPEEPPAGDVIPTIYSNNATIIKSVTATTGGNITSDGGATITARGVCYSTSSAPDLTDNVIYATGTTGTYSVELSQLQSNTTYYVRAFATNAEGTAYGAEASFTTKVYTHTVNSGKVLVNNGKIVIIQ